MESNGLMASLVGGIQRIEVRLDRMEAQSRLGFGMPPVTQRVNCNRNHGGCWYVWDGGNKVANVIADPAVTGYARALAVVQGEYKGKVTHNLELTLDCGPQWYILTAGSDSMFSKKLLLSLGMLQAEQFRQTLTIAPKAGDEEKVLLCSVWCGKEYIKSEWSEDSAIIRGCFSRAQQAIQQVNQ